MSYTHTHTPKHTSTQTPLCNKQREQSFCLLRCEALNDTAVYVNVHVCEHLIIHPSPPTSLPLVHSLFSPHPQPAFQQPATKTQRFQKTSRHLSPSLHLLLFNSPTHTQPQRNSVSSGQARAEMIFSPLLLPASDLPTPTVPFPLSVNLHSGCGRGGWGCGGVCARERMSSWECVVVFSEIPAWAYDRTVWLRFTMLLRECEHTHAEIHIQPHKHAQEPPVCVSGSLWSMPQESSCCLYGCALCSLLLRGTQPCCSPDERACFSPSPAVRQKAWRLLAQILPCPANSLF